MKNLEMILLGTIIAESFYIVNSFFKNRKNIGNYENILKKYDELKNEASKVSIDKIEIERKIDEKNFKFLAINQMAKTLAKEKSLLSLKTLIMDMLLEVNSVKAGLSFENIDGNLKIYELKNI